MRQTQQFGRKYPTPAAFAYKRFIKPKIPQVQRRIVRPVQEFGKKYPTPMSYIRPKVQEYLKPTPQVRAVDLLREAPDAASRTVGPKMIQRGAIQPFARGVASVVQEATGGKEFTPETTLEKQLLGEKRLGGKPIKIVPTRRYAEEELELKPGKLGKWAIPAGIAMAGMDIVPVGFGKGNIAKQIAKTKNIGKIFKVLKRTNIANEAIPTISKKLASITDVKKVTQAISKAEEMMPKITQAAKGARKAQKSLVLQGRGVGKVTISVRRFEYGKARFPSRPQDIFKPKGTYFAYHPSKGITPELPRGAKSVRLSDIKFENPLTLPFENWKKNLSTQFGGLKGKELTNALRKRGYDGIVTTMPDGLPHEIVSLGKKATQKAKGIVSKQIRITSKSIKGKVPISYPNVAVRITQSGKKVPAIRRGSGVSAEKAFETHAFKDANIGKTDNILSAVTNADNIKESQIGAKGIGPLTKRYFDFSASVSKKIQWADQQKQQIGRIFKNTSSKSRQTIAEILNGKNVGTSEEKAIATQLRTVLDDLINKANVTRKAMGKDPVPYRKDYFSHMRKTGFWNELLGDTKTQISEQLDFIIPNTKKNPFAERRLASEMANREKNPLKVFDRYIDAISSDIYTTPEIEKWKVVNEVLKGRGMTKTSGFIDRWIRENVVGKPAQLDISLGLDSKVAQNVMKRITRARNLSVLGFNIPWSLVTQPASMMVTLAKTMTSSKGALRWFNPATRAQIEKLPTMVRKTYKGVGTTLGGDVDRASRSLYRSKLDKVNDVLAMMSNSIERHVTGMSIAAGYDRAAAKGIKGKDAARFAQYIGETTQSMYDAISRPLSLNSKAVRTAFPFQTFSHEVFRYAKTLAGKSGGIPLDARTRLGQAVALVTGMYLYSEYISKPILGRAIGSVGTFIPFAGSYVDKKITDLKRIGKEAVGIEDQSTFGTATGRAPIAPLEDIDKIIRAMDALVKHKNINPLRKEMINWGTGFAGVGGGVQINRFIDGLIASETGYQTTKSGNVAFPVEGTLEKTKSMILGPYGTSEGKQYIKDNFPSLSEKQSEIYKSLSGSKDYYSSVMANRQKNKEIEKLKGDDQGGEGGTLPDGTTVRKIGRDFRVFDTPQEADLAVRKEDFKQSGDEYKWVGEDLWTIGESGELNINYGFRNEFEAKSAYDQMQKAKDNNDLDTWFKAAENNVKFMEAQIATLNPENPADRLKISDLEDKIRNTIRDAEKYGGYGGFKKPKKGKKAKLPKYIQGPARSFVTAPVAPRVAKLSTKVGRYLTTAVRKPAVRRPAIRSSVSRKVYRPKIKIRNI